MDFDGSSYPKAAPQQYDPFGAIGKANQIEQQGLAIDRQKLENFNQKYDIVERGLGNLVNQPDLDGDHFIRTYQNFVKAGVMTPEQAAQEMSAVPTKAGSKSEQDYKERLRKLAETHLLNAQEKKAAIDHYAGQNTTIDTGQNIVSGRQGALRATGQGMAPSPFQQGSYTPRQLPVGTPGVDANNNPAFNPGGNAPVTVQSGGPLPVARPAQSKLPIAQDVGPAEAASNSERVMQGGGASTFKPAPPANFTEGKEQYNRDITLATDKLTQVKPAQQALKLMTPEILNGLTGTGPIAATLSKGISAVNGVLGLKGDLADRVAAREEIVKKMHKYVSNSSVAGRSDAAQILAEASSPHPNVQSLKALVNLTRDAIASDRVEAARALSFENKGNNYQEYQLHRAGFPNAIDQDAFKLDMMPPKERDELIEKMKKTDNKLERERFINSLKIAKKLNMFD